MSNKMNKQVPSIEMFEALVATVNNLSAQLAHTNKELSALRDKVNTKHEVYVPTLERPRPYFSDNTRITSAKIPDYSRVSNASIPGLNPWRNDHGQ